MTNHSLKSMPNHDTNNVWKLLIVDDQPDVHTIMRMVFRKRTWAGRRFELTSAFGHLEARDLLQAASGEPFHLVFTDGAMECMASGFLLAQAIRNDAGLSVPIILHSDIYSESYVRFHHGNLFDAIIPKATTTANQLHDVICSCLPVYHRSSSPQRANQANRQVERVAADFKNHLSRLALLASY